MLSGDAHYLKRLRIKIKKIRLIGFFLFFKLPEV